MNKNIIIISLAIIFLNLILIQAQIPQIVPYVNDFANVLTSEEETNLNLLCDEIEQNTTWEIAIVTIPNTEGQDRIEYANKIGDVNGVGKKDADNGIVVLWSLDNEKGGAIATGRYSESIFNDAKVGRMGRESRPLFDEEKYYDGFMFIVNEIKKEINVDGTISLKVPEAHIDDYILWIIIGAALIFGIIILPIINSSSSSNNSSGSYGGVSTLGGWGHSSGGSSSGGFSLGSFGGGGGKF
jgi:uncharacterized protein